MRQMRIVDGVGAPPWIAPVISRLVFSIRSRHLAVDPVLGGW
jgi:hypothetical protein